MGFSKCYHETTTIHAMGKPYSLDITVIKELSEAQKKFRNDVKSEVKAFFIKHWEDFGDEFFDISLFGSKWLVLVRNQEQLIGVATIHKKILEGKAFYNFKTDAIDPKYQVMGLLERMNQILFRFAYIDNLWSQKSLWFNAIFTTPNLRIIGFFVKHTHAVYPNPYLYDREKQSLPLPNEKTWKYVQAYNKVDYPPDLPLSKEACVVEDRLSRWPYNCYEKNGFPYYKDEIVNDFGDHYLAFKEGKQRMFVVCAFVSPWDVVRYFFTFMKKCFRRIFY